MAENPNNKERKFKVDRVWFIDKGIELSIFVLGFLIALYIDDVRDAGQIKQLKEHHLEIVQLDLEKDLVNYQLALEHDSLRSLGCDLVLEYLVKRQRSELYTQGVLMREEQSWKGPGTVFQESKMYAATDTIEIITEEKGWCLTQSGDWVDRSKIQRFNTDFSWFSNEIMNGVKEQIDFYAFYIDETKSVFQHKTGYLGLISQNTSAFLNTTEVETQLSDYYSFGSYLNWLEDYYRDNHYPLFNELRYSFGEIELFQFLFMLSTEQNNDLIQQISLASIHSKKEVRYYQEAISMNKSLQQLLKDKNQ